MCIPPISTLRSGFRAYWVNCARRGRLDDRPAHPAREADALAVDVGAGLAQQPQRVGVAAELDADLLEDRVGVVLDERQALLAEDLERRQRPGQERDVLGVRARAAAPAGRLGRRSGAVAVSSISRPPWCRPRPRGGVVVPVRAVGAGGPSSAPSAGSATTAARCGKAAVLCGKAIASTKCSWKRGSTAVSIFSTRRTTPSISVRAAPDSSAMSAPVPAALPADRTWARSQSGIEPEDHRVDRVDLAAERAGQPDLVDRVDAELVHQQPDAGVERGLGELDGADVVLGDERCAAAAVRRRRGGRS